MKLPEAGPDFRLILSKAPDKFNGMMISEEANEIIRRSNNEYLPWEDFKYKAAHPSFSPEELWAFLKVSRLRSMKKLLFTDSDGNRFSYWLPDSTLESLHHIDKSVGGAFFLEEAGIPPEAKRQYLVSSLMEEAIASSQIEGAITTRRVAKEMLRKRSKPKNRSEQMIVNNYKTILTIKDAIDQPMSVELINRFHRMIAENTLDDPSALGRFRTKSEPVQVVDSEGQVLHTPPGVEKLQKLMEDLCDFANDKKNKEEFIHPVVRAIILHFWLAYLHPYVDGNGRTARALFYWYMLRHGYWLFEYLSISRVILNSRVQYHKAFLHTEQDDLDLTYFISYHLRAIGKAIKELQDYIKRKQRQYREVLALLKRASWMNYRQQAVVQHALKHPGFIYTVQSHKTSHNVTPQTARTDLLALAQKGYLEKLKTGRKLQFAVPGDLPRKVARLSP